jgi:hypothetical protein
MKEESRSHRALARVECHPRGASRGPSDQDRGLPRSPSRGRADRPPDHRCTSRRKPRHFSGSGGAAPRLVEKTEHSLPAGTDRGRLLMVGTGLGMKPGWHGKAVLEKARRVRGASVSSRHSLRRATVVAGHTRDPRKRVDGATVRWRDEASHGLGDHPFRVKLDLQAAGL